ncbi:uncharacterized protein VTP21DRAFT_10356 [Calcarisporiella thermophila]|uniref:uncharacterized protein n=1 Tax=Calcarisporiella thermophila TaxID=911321 RepID=UPI0037439E09
MNSASKVLTLNLDRYFIAFKEPGDRATRFRLAYEPANFESAVKAYNEWMKKLIEHDWPLCFGKKKEKSPGEEPRQGTVECVEAAEDANIKDSKRKRERENETNGGNAKKVCVDASTQTTFLYGSCDDYDSECETPAHSNGLESDELQHASKPSATSGESKPLPSDDPSWVNIDELDLSDVPKSIHDIVEVRPSTIPGAGSGLFAKRFLPYNTPLGFYFGVPMTEDEYDSLKDGVGLASNYSIMYRKSVLDATDERGQPFTDPGGPLYCPFHFMNENPEKAGIIFLEGNVVNQVICWTKRDIQPEEELFVWYGKEVERSYTLSTPEISKRRRKAEEKKKKQ